MKETGIRKTGISMGSQQLSERTEKIDDERLIRANRHHVVERMRSAGFEVVETTGVNTEYPDEKFSYYWNNELVGWSYDNILYLSKSPPSLVDKKVGEGGMQEVPFDYPISQIDEMLNAALDKIMYSIKNYDKHIREYRVRVCREYFQRHKRLSELDPILIEARDSFPVFLQAAGLQT